MAAAHDYDAAAELARFHGSRAGVRGLVESGVTAVPPLFSTPTTTMPPTPQAPATPPAFTIPVVDLSLPRPDTVALVRAAARSRGFFHATNHRVPAGVVACALAAVRAFHEQPLTARSAFYSLDPIGPVAYSTIPITQQQQGDVADAPTPTLPWHDSLRVRFGPGEPELGDLQPPWCRDALRVYQRALTGFGEEMAGLLSEALGVGAARLEQELRVRGWLMACHYYPPCPEPASVVGSREHTDPGVFTVLAQDGVGGLQVRYDDHDDGDGGGSHDDGGGVWVDVVPVAGALLVNIGELLKVVSSDEYKSVEHRVVIKSKQDARVSIALFFNPAKRGDSDRFGPLPELVTAERTAGSRNTAPALILAYKKA